MQRLLLRTSFTICFVMVIAILPLAFGQTEGELTFRPYFFLVIPEYIMGLFDGRSLIYYVRGRPFNFFDFMPVYFMTSLFYVALTSLIGVVLGFMVGILSYRHRVSKSQDILTFIQSIPDFFMILLLQLAIIKFNELTGIRLAKIGMVTSMPILLPLIAMSIYPVLFISKQISTATYTVACQDYILFAQSKGLTRFNIFKCHVIPALIHQLKADSTKMILMILSNLLITEQLFRINGLTRMMFINGIEGKYQFQLVVNSLLLLSLLYLIIRFGVWLLIQTLSLLTEV
jgi:peptide/nickel transport system permease protein